MIKSEIIKQNSHFRKLGEFCVKMPWPFWNRSVYLGVTAMPVRGENSILLIMKSVKETWLGHEVHKDPNCTECEFHFASAFIETISADQQRLRFMFSADPKFSSIPPWLLN